MKLTKRILSLCLALAMLLTVATFPAFAEEYTPKTVELKASVFAKKQTGPNIFARPADYNLKAGDSLAIADGAVLNSAWYTAMGLSAEQVKGIEIKYGTSFGGMSSVYLKLESDGTMAGFYTSVDFTTPATITLETAGIYVFTSQNYVNASGEKVAFLATYPNDIDNPNNGCLWAIEVKPADTPEVTNPDKGNYTIGTVGTLTLTEEITEQNAATATGNIAYIEDLSIQGVITPDKKIDGESTTPFTFIKASNTVGNMSPWGGFRIDLETVTYLEKLSIKTGLWGASMYWDLYGSLDGTSWYYINSASAATVNGILENISVDAVVKHLRLVVTDATNLYGQTAFDVTVITGATATYNAGEEEPTTVDVTFVNVDGVTADEVKTIDAGATVTVPDAYATGYKFYADADCTEEVDLATETFDADTTIYVKAQTTTPDPDPEQPTGPKTIGLEASVRSSHARYDGALFLARPSDDVYVNDSLTIADNQTITIPANVYRGSSGAKIYLTSDTSNSDTIAQITGFEVIYGQNVNDMWHKAYVKVDANGVMSGFYSDATFATTKDITFTTAGTYLFGIQNYVDATGTLQNLKKISVSWDQFNSRDNSYMWAVNVKDPANQLVTAPNNADYDITSGTAIALDTNLIQGSAAVTATEGNLAYTEDIVPEGLTVDTRASDSYKDKNFTITKADNTATITGPASGLRIDFTDISYVGDLKIKRYQYDTDFKYDVYGSLDGETWYLIGDANRLGVRSGDSTYTISVDAVVKHLRVYYRDEVTACGYVTYNISAITGQIGVEYIGGGEEPAGPQVKDENDNVLFDEITDDVLATLPSYFKVSGKNYVVKSWTMDGEAIDYVALKKLTADDVTGDIVPELVEVPFDVAKLSKDATKSDKDDTAFDEGAKYVNGLYIQGAQIRFRETNVTAGLRFVNVVDRELEATLEALVEAGTISGLDHGTLAIGGVNYDNVDLTVDNTGVNNTGDKIYKTADLFDDKYYKYTLCVTGFQPEQYELSVYVRPYITFTYGTETVYLYGEQYKTNYKAVVQEAVRVGGLTEEQLSYCNGILG